MRRKGLMLSHVLCACRCYDIRHMKIRKNGILNKFSWELEVNQKFSIKRFVVFSANFMSSLNVIQKFTNSRIIRIIRITDTNKFYQKHDIKCHKHPNPKMFFFCKKCIKFDNVHKTFTRICKMLQNYRDIIVASDKTFMRCKRKQMLRRRKVKKTIFLH